MICFGANKYEKFNKKTIYKCWKELRSRFLPNNQSELLNSTSKLRGDFVFENEALKKSLGEFALERLHWAYRKSDRESDEKLLDEWKLITDPQIFSLNITKTEEAQKEKLNTRHAQRNRNGMEISPNIIGFSLSQVRLFCERIRTLKEIDSTILLNKTLNINIADFSIRYLCNLEFKRYMQKNKID